MRNHAYLLLLAPFALLFAVLLSLPAQAEPKQRSAVFDELKCNTLTIKSKDGSRFIHAGRIGEDGVGIWVGHGKSTFQIIDMPNQHYIGIHNKASSDGLQPCPVAVGLDKGGEPYIQLIEGKKIRMIDLRDLIDGAKK